MNLALDLGQKMGFTYFEGLKIIECGTFNLPATATKKEGSVLTRKYIAIQRMIAKKPVEHVYYEMTDWHRSGYPAEPFPMRQMREKQNRVVQRALGRIEMAIEAACFEYHAIPVAVAVHDAKRVLTGNGNASKAMIAKEIKSLFPQLKNESSQDAIDSVSIMIWAVSQESSMWRIDLANINHTNF